MKKKILFVHHCSTVGGASWCLYEILKGLDRQCFEPVILLSSEGPLVGRIRAMGIPVVVDPTVPIFPIYGDRQVLGLMQLLKVLLVYPRAFRFFYRHCREIKPDVVYLNSSAQLLLPWPAKKADVPKVIFHNREHWDPKGLLKVKLLIRNWIINRFVDRVFSITQCGIEAIGFPGKSIVVRDWPSFDDESEENIREQLGISTESFVILLTGGLMSIKGTLDVLKALAVMRSREQVSVVVLGCSQRKDARWKKLLKKLLKRTSYADRIRAFAADNASVSLLSPTFKVKAYMTQSNVLVAPFIMPHAAKAALEAQSLGCPVVLYDSSEAREYVHHGETGLIIPYADVGALAAALDDLVQNPEKTMRLGAAGPEFISEQFDQKQSMERIHMVLELDEEFTGKSLIAEGI